MTQSSVYEYCVKMDTAALDADYPADANNSMYYANNLHHLFDMSTQLRVNWVGQSTAECPVLASSAMTHFCSHVFPVSFSGYGGYPEDLVVRVGAAVAAGTASFEAFVSPATWNVSNQDRDKYIAKLTGTTNNTGADPEWIIQSRIGDQYDDDTPALMQQAVVRSRYYTESGGTKQAAEMAMMRLSIFAEGSGGGEAGMYIFGVSVREFHYEP